MCDSFMKAPCKHCPFRVDVKPYLHPVRAEEIAYASQNPYNSFPCHKTTESVEDEDGESDRIATENSKECAGFLTLRAQYLGDDDLPEGFKPSWDLVYAEACEMIDAYQEEWDKQRGGAANG